MKQIIFYQKQNGKVPVKEFLNELAIKNSDLNAKILQKIDLLLLDRLGKDEVKYIGDKIYELRIKQSSNISRIFYFTIQNEKIVLLDGIIKKTQKLDNSIIEKVKKYKDDFLKCI
ncbi:MAG: type II toxin-antitoxin system RelE/ParE family toxin [Candidatus Gracilibacteria bacterium]